MVWVRVFYNDCMAVMKLPISFVFDEKKAAQATAYLLKLSGGQMNYMVLIKLLYMADRKSLIVSEMPITGSHMVSMPHGPVLSEILDLINMGSPDSGNEWFRLISEPSNYSVSLKEEPDFEELSDFEIEILEGIYQRFGSMDKWRLKDMTHELPEWVDPEGGSLPVDTDIILESAGKSPEDIARIKSDARELAFFSRMKNS